MLIAEGLNSSGTPSVDTLRKLRAAERKSHDRKLVAAVENVFESTVAHLISMIKVNILAFRLCGWMISPQNCLCERCCSDSELTKKSNLYY